MLTATSDYRAEMDVIQGFLEDECTVETGLVVRAKTMQQAYKKWCDANNETPLSAKRLAQRLKERGFESGRDKDGRYWKGLSMRDHEMKLVEQGSLSM